MHCNLRSPDATPALSRFNYDAMPSLKSINLSAAVGPSVSTVDTFRCDLVARKTIHMTNLHTEQYSKESNEANAR